MVLSYYLTYIPYTLLWHWKKLRNQLLSCTFYCKEPLDYDVFAPVAKYLPPLVYTSESQDTLAYLRDKGLTALPMPAYARSVIMARHALHRFPCSAMLKIGMRHGAYHFKKLTSAASYNLFDLYLMTSRADVAAGEEIGIHSAKAVGFPKLDPAFDGSISPNDLQHLRDTLGFDDKPIVLFTATYHTSGMSAVDKWYSRISELRHTWNVLVTLHPWLPPVYREYISSLEGIRLISGNAVPYIMLANACVGDVSSILAECCALDKPLITFSHGSGKRSLEEIEMLLTRISYVINEFDELPLALRKAREHPEELSHARAQANILMFDTLDGKAGQRAASEIMSLLAPVFNKGK